jgi:hypothetical protein
MSLMRSEIYDAFRSVGVPHEHALQAAVAVYARGIPPIRTDRVTPDLATLQADIRLLHWLASINLVLTAAICWKVFSA